MRALLVRAIFIVPRIVSGTYSAPIGYLLNELMSPSLYIWLYIYLLVQFLTFCYFFISFVYSLYVVLGCLTNLYKLSFDLFC